MPNLFTSLSDIVNTKTKQGKSKLGSGSFGEVRLVTHRNTPSIRYAMKII